MWFCWNCFRGHPVHVFWRTDPAGFGVLESPTAAPVGFQSLGLGSVVCGSQKPEWSWIPGTNLLLELQQLGQFLDARCFFSACGSVSAENTGSKLSSSAVFGCSKLRRLLLRRLSLETWKWFGVSRNLGLIQGEMKVVGTDAARLGFVVDIPSAFSKWHGGHWPKLETTLEQHETCPKGNMKSSHCQECWVCENE